MPKGFLRTEWGLDPFTLGAFSSLGAGAEPEDYDTLAAPVRNKLFFAGEATNRQYPGTVHGEPSLSGRREAARIAKVLKA